MTVNIPRAVFKIIPSSYWIVAQNNLLVIYFNFREVADEAKRMTFTKKDKILAFERKWKYFSANQGGT
jgi:hypothetical protein